MKNTAEQEAIIEASKTAKSLVVNALAGSGKTSTAIQCVKANHKQCPRMIYLSFNRSVAMSMKEKLGKMGVYGPEITTLHSLAFRRLGSKFLDAGRSLGALKPYDIAPIVDRHFRHTSGNNVSDRFILNRCRKLALDRVEAWCGSAAATIDDFFSCRPSVEFEETVKVYNIDPASIDVAAKDLWDSILEDKDLKLTHGAYLKLFHLEALKDPSILAYNLAIVDEAQDLFPVTEALVHIMHKAGSRIILFGDRYQQIYTWNGSVNSIQRFENSSQILSLTQSFRCPAPVTKAASKYLKLLGFEGTFKPAPAPCILEHKSPIIISRTNSSLFANITGCDLPTKKIHLVGGIESYNFTPISDYLNFLSGDKARIKSPVIANMNTAEEYDEYADAVNDVEMRNARTVVKRLGPPKAWNILKSAEKGEFAATPKEAELCLSTGHKCKGSEFQVVMADPSFENLHAKLFQATPETKKTEEDPERERIIRMAKAQNDALIYPMEELRLDYVTLTRSTDNLRPGPLHLEDNAVDQIIEARKNGKLVLTDADEYGNTIPVL